MHPFPIPCFVTCSQTDCTVVYSGPVYTQGTDHAGSHRRQVKWAGSCCRAYSRPPYCCRRESSYDRVIAPLLRVYQRGFSAASSRLPVRLNLFFNNLKMMIIPNKELLPATSPIGIVVAVLNLTIKLIFELQSPDDKFEVSRLRKLNELIILANKGGNANFNVAGL